MCDNELLDRYDYVMRQLSNYDDELSEEDYLVANTSEFSRKINKIKRDVDKFIDYALLRLRDEGINTEKEVGSIMCMISRVKVYHISILREIKLIEIKGL